MSVLDCERVNGSLKVPYPMTFSQMPPAQSGPNGPFGVCGPVALVFSWTSRSFPSAVCVCVCVSVCVSVCV